MKHGIKKKYPAVLALVLSGAVCAHAGGFVYAGDVKEEAFIAQAVPDIAAEFEAVPGEGMQTEEYAELPEQTEQPGAEGEIPEGTPQEEAPETSGETVKEEAGPEAEGDVPQTDAETETDPETDGEILQIETEPGTGGDVTQAEEVPDTGVDTPQEGTEPGTGEDVPQADGEPSSSDAFTDGEQEEPQPETEIELKISEEPVIYHPGSKGVWNPVVHRYEGSVPGEWSCEDSGLEVQLTNRGAAEKVLTLLYFPASGFEQITGDFTGADGNSVVEISVPAGGSATVYLHLHGEPEEKMTDTTIGSVTYKLAEEA